MASNSLTPAPVDSQRALLEAVQAQMPAGLIVVQVPSGRLTYFNGTAERLLGHPVHATADVGDYVRYGGEHEDGTPYAAEEYPTARAVAGEVVDKHALRYRRGDGSLAHLSVSAAPVRDADGRITHAVCTFVDVTEQRRTSAALAEQRERLRAALDASGTGTFRWDIATNALDWDENLDRLFGLEPGRTARSLEQFLAMVHPDDRARVIAACERCAAAGVDFDEEFRVVWPNDVVRWLHDKGKTFRDARGRPAYMTGACVDVTERRQQSEQLSTLAETIPQIVWTTTADGYHDYFNSRWYEFTGMPRPNEPGGEHEVPRGWSWADYLHPDDLGRSMARWRRSLDTGEPYEVEYRFRERATGKYRWFIGRALPLRDAAGRVTRWFGTCTDIESQVQSAELAQRLQQVTARLAAALSSSDVVAEVADAGRSAVGAMASSLALLAPDGRTLELVAVRGDSPAEVNAEWATFPLDAPVPVAEAVRTGRPVVLGSRADLMRRAPALRDTVERAGVRAGAAIPLLVGERAIGALGVVFGASEQLSGEQLRFLDQLAQLCAQALERVRLFEAAEAARAEAERANRAKAEFLAVMSHELRSPLNAIDGHAALIEDAIYGPVNDAQRDAVRRIRRSGGHLLSLINDLLGYARIEAGRTEYHMAAVPLDALLRELDAFVGPQMEERHLTYWYEGLDASVAVRADADRLRQILLNLLTNAMKFTLAGGRIDVRAEREDGRVLVYVRDSGVGIAPGKLAEIFEPFVQVDASETRRQQGVGLGLAISRRLARDMGGDIAVTSDPGAGSTFTLSLRSAD